MQLATIIRLSKPLVEAGYSIGDTVELVDPGYKMDAKSTWDDGLFHEVAGVRIPAAWPAGTFATCYVGIGLHVEVLP